MNDRNNTIPPPPNPDRERDTDRPNGSEHAASNGDSVRIEGVRISEQVALRLDVFDQNLKALREEFERLNKLDELHALLTSVQVDTDSDRKVTVLDVLLEMNAKLVAVKANSEVTLERLKQYVNEVIRVHDDNKRIELELAEHSLKLAKIESKLPPAVHKH